MSVGGVSVEGGWGEYDAPVTNSQKVEKRMGSVYGNVEDRRERIARMEDVVGGQLVQEHRKGSPLGN